MQWEFFDNIFCISLRDRIDRREKAAKIFKELGIPVKFFIVDRHPNGGIYGCFDSHIKIIEFMNKNNKNNILVFEDDIEPTNSYDIKHIQNAVNFMKSNQTWDLFYLGYFPVNYTNLYLTSLNITDNIVQYNPFATHAYCINKRAIPKIYNNYYQYIGKLHVDIYFSGYASLNNYCYLPILFEQKMCEDSDIEPGNLIEFVARKNQCLIHKTKIFWRSSIIKYYINTYLSLLIFIILILFIVIVTITNKRI
jgi:GR25 family glycosyltransferase involved in LPS biosynthesis